jgi:hypothetical protein
LRVRVIEMVRGGASRREEAEVFSVASRLIRDLPPCAKSLPQTCRYSSARTIPPMARVPCWVQIGHFPPQSGSDHVRSWRKETYERWT